MTGLIILLVVALAIVSSFAVGFYSTLCDLQAQLRDARSELATERRLRSTAQVRAGQADRRVARTSDQLRDVNRQLALTSARCQVLLNTRRFYELMHRDLMELRDGR